MNRAEPWGIDPDLFLDPATGKTYLTLMSIKSEAEPYWGIHQCEVNLENGRCTSDFNLIFSGTLPNTLSARPEGPHIYKIGAWYYLLIAEGKSIDVGMHYLPSSIILECICRMHR